MTPSRFQRQVSFGGLGPMSGGKSPRDVLILLGVVFAAFALQFFASTALVPAPRLPRRARPR